MSWMEEGDRLTQCGCGNPGAHPPCSWCTRECDEDDEEAIEIVREETPEEAYDRAMKPLG